MNIIYGGDEAFGALAFGLQNPANRQVFDNQLQHAISTVGNAFGEYGQRFVDNAKRMHESFNNSRVMELARAALNQVSGIFQADVVRRISSLNMFQIATPVMQGWLMANPVVRQMWQEQRCDGFSDSYVDHDPGKIGEDHYAYRRVVNGMINVQEKDWNCDTFAEDLRGDDKELEFDEQCKILDSWESIERIMLQGMKDATSAWNSDL
mgnify:CR=1 FL=1